MIDSPIEDLPEEHLAAVRRFITTDFDRVNAALRALDPERLDELDGFIREIVNGLYYMPSFRGVVFRGATLSPAVARLYEPGYVIYERAMISAAADPACRFPGNTTFVIASINGRDVSSLAEKRDEGEVLFFAGTSFKVLATEYDARADDLTVYLAEIPDPRLFQGFVDDGDDGDDSNADDDPDNGGASGDRRSLS